MCALLMNYTKGPWSLDPARSTKVDLVNDPKGHAVGEVVWVDVRNPADAWLIKHAPQMFEALNSLHLAVTMRPIGSDGLSSVERAALDGARDLLNQIKRVHHG